MARRSRMVKYMRTAPKSAVKPTKLEASEEAVIFGSRGAVKRIVVMMVVFGFVLSGVFLLMFGENLQASLGRALAVLIFGGLLGMVIGQMIFVHPYRQLVVPTLTMMFFAVVLWFMAFLMQAEWQVTRDNFPALVGLLFVFGFVGYWLGYWAYQRKVRERQRFQGRQRSHVTRESQVDG